MENLEKILEIKVDVGQAIQGIANLNKIIDEQRAYQKALREEIKRMTEAEGENSDAVIELQNAYVLSQQKVKDYQSQVAGLSKTVQNQLKIEREQIGSNTQLRAQLSNLTKAYDELSKEEREAAQGVELKNKINEVTDALKNSEEATQRYYRNVGNYENAIKNSLGLNSKFGQTLQNVADVTSNGVGPALKETATATANVGKQMLKLLANPIVAFLAGVATAVMAVVKGIKSSEDNMAKLKEITASFKPILDIVTKAFQSFASVILNVAGFIGRIVEGISEWLEKAPMIGETIKQINEENARYGQLEKDKQKLIERNRQLIVDESAAELQVSELRVKAKQKELYTDEERLKFVQEANEVERKIAEEKKAVAEERLRILQEEAAATENTAEINDELARAEAEVNRAIIAYNTKKRELLEQENTIKNEILAKDKARRDETKKADEQKLKDQEEYNKTLEEAIRETEDMLIELLEEGEKKQIDIENLRHKRKLQELEDKKQQYADDFALTVEFQKQIEAERDIHQKNLKAINDEARAAEEAAQKEADDKAEAEAEAAAKRRIELKRMELDSYASIAGSISAILEATAGDDKKRLKAAKVAALAEIAINQGLAIANAVRAVGAAVPPIPFPVNVAMIASSVASAISAIAPAIQAVNSVKLARGGRVTGAGTSTSDSIPAMLSNGEYVVNARATSMFPELLETINRLGLGIASPVRMETVSRQRQEQMTQASLMAAIAAMPAPVVSVKEFTRVEKRVESLENLSRLNS